MLEQMPTMAPVVHMCVNKAASYACSMYPGLDSECDVAMQQTQASIDTLCLVPQHLRHTCNASGWNNILQLHPPFCAGVGSLVMWEMQVDNI